MGTLPARHAPGPTGTPRFVAASDASGHADRAWALFLALSAAKETAPIDYIPVPRRAFDDVRRDGDDDNPRQERAAW